MFCTYPKGIHNIQCKINISFETSSHQSLLLNQTLHTALKKARRDVLTADIPRNLYPAPCYPDAFIKPADIPLFQITSINAKRPECIDQIGHGLSFILSLPVKNIFPPGQGCDR
jgi:hypothetical protein